MSLTLFSCKDSDVKETEPTITTEEPAIDQNIFTVVLTAVVPKDDSFQLFYQDDAAQQFEDKKSLFVEFKGSDQPQDIVFKLPADELPYFLRLDFGVNKEQGPMVIKNFKIQYLGKTFEAHESDFFKYFYSNEQNQKVDTTTATVTPIITQGGSYDPMFASAEGLSKQIDALVK